MKDSQNFPAAPEGSAAGPGSALLGRPWKAVINGQRPINGTRHRITLTGTIERAAEWSSIIDVMHDLAEHIEEHTKEMQIKDSFQVTLYPPNDSRIVPRLRDA